MITVVSIILYAISVFAGCLIGFGAGQTKGQPADDETKRNLSVLAVALILFFGLATVLQVTS